jgi:hypothetical protein
VQDAVPRFFENITLQPKTRGDGPDEAFGIVDGPTEAVHNRIVPSGSFSISTDDSRVAERNRHLPRLGCIREIAFDR